MDAHTRQHTRMQSKAVIICCFIADLKARVPANICVNKALGTCHRKMRKRAMKKELIFRCRCHLGCRTLFLPLFYPSHHSPVHCRNSLIQFRISFCIPLPSTAFLCFNGSMIVANAYKFNTRSNGSNLEN